jgi:hypothetical protein
MGWLPHLRRSLTFRRLAGALVLGAALLVCPLPAPGGAIWDIGIGLGYVAVPIILTLYIYPLRGEGLPHRRLFTLSQHRRVGWAVLILSGLHVAILVAAQPLVGHYLLPSAPYYMLAGLAGLIALGLLIATGLSARQALRRSGSSTASLSSHAVLAPLLSALIAAHLIGSGQLLDTRSKVLTSCLLLAIPLLWTANRSLRRRARQDGARASHVLTTVVPCCLAAIVLFLLPVPIASSRLLQPATPPAPLPVHFPHEKHTTVNCVTCHHNFVDKTGIGSCLDCHRSARADLTRSAEATFHTFCRNCHSQLAATTAKHGPTRACSPCHTSTRQMGADPTSAAAHQPRDPSS